MFSRAVFYLVVSTLLLYINNLVVDKAVDELMELTSEKNRRRNNTTQSES